MITSSHDSSVVFLLTALVAYGVCTRTDFYQHNLGEKPQDMETKQVILLYPSLLNFVLSSLSRLRDCQCLRFFTNLILSGTFVHFVRNEVIRSFETT